MRITVVGCGYLGATHAACMAELGHMVLGVDIAQDTIHHLARGIAPFYEPGLDSLLLRHTKSGRLSLSTSYQEAADFGDVHFLTVGTPQQQDGGSYDLTQVFDAAAKLAVHIDRPATIVGKSTVPVGTASKLAQLVSALAPARDAVEVAWNPEFLRESSAVHDTLDPDRIVIGCEPGSVSESRLREVYRDILATGTPLVITNPQTAELTKCAANSFLAMKISFINALSEICESAGADVLHLADALSFDKRIGGAGMRPGIGFGGGCLPKDIRGFMESAHRLGVGGALKFLACVDEINQRCRERMVTLTRKVCGGSVAGRRITVWGASFKPGTDDVRDSPALAVAATLFDEGANVRVHDPRAVDKAQSEVPQLSYFGDPVSAARGADVILHLTDWEEYASLRPETLTPVVKQCHIVDGRGSLNEALWNSAGWQYWSLGRPALNSPSPILEDGATGTQMSETVPPLLTPTIPGLA
ncbi:UDP-glucose/GDP-mannose dehydrogenase family protein [Streptomyces sp. TRM72054]|uniref:UDP-glucose dehydrogenase family protein n=1 Tax=Streptomyces sp. TRM72054 TaxID=2870562 RepID=UPI001C8C03FE|nr:UDP-glucose/GDP-mannose dehydrogenase family protein [Streptomyces sp. TRM72054]MBX9393432.1 UDP-glucose/GDP-mannose dehydrogenase family protein [Streptomyces sp. TRM72054]